MNARLSSRDSRAGQARKAVLLVLVSVLMALLILELIARAVLPAPLPWLYPQIRYRPDPDVVFSLLPQQVAFTADKSAVINERGLRGSTIPFQRNARALRLLFLGDSIGFGYGVEEENTTSSVVRRLMTEGGWETEIINTGVPAYNTEQEVTFLEKRGLQYRFDWVIVEFCWNDIGSKSGVTVSPEGFLVSAGQAQSATSARNRFMESPSGYSMRNFLKRSRLLYGGVQGLSAVRGFLAPDQQALFQREVLSGLQTARVVAGWNNMAETLHRLNLLAQAHRFQVLIVAYPIPYALQRFFPSSSYPARLSELARSEGLPLIDLYDAYRRTYRGHTSLFIPYDGDHPNELGHQIAGQEIAKYLLTTDTGPRQGRLER
jgi:lysophospholipase L1-like esterase